MNATVCTAHHWLIAASQGATSEGVCKRCKETRTFSNIAEEKSWQVWRETGLANESKAGGWNRWL